MVERGALKAGMIRQSSSHSIEVFFGHPGWGGDSVGYKINLARDEFNFTTLRQHLTKHLIAGEVDDFVGPVIVHQCDKETIEIVLDKNQLSLNLLRDPKVPSRYAAFEAPGSKTFTFDTSDAAQSACHLAQTIINRSSSYMEQVNEKWGLGKYQAI